ncbi:uncharacterized protein LOC133737773 [Rosa rugosa]|uniref:uncharacterized protein LOC133737773 n=1 Tax=Rosa rugosa TaxID=74645 RepID=UPI002B413988|nr:uncharacterized protein LOC133737773 [Rosa rugosa]
MASNLVQSQIPLLKTENYEKWCIQFKALFGSQDLLEIVQSGYDEHTLEQEATYSAEQKSTLKDQRKRDKKALYFLYQGLDDSTFEKIAEVKTSKEVWDALSIIFKGVDRVKRVCLQSQRADFESAQMSEGENVSDYYSRLRIIVNEMKRNGEKIDEVHEHVVTSIEESKDLEIMSTEELLGSIRVHEQRIQKNASST